MVAAALAAGCRPQTVFLREEAADELGERLGLDAGAVAAGRARRPAARRVRRHRARRRAHLDAGDAGRRGRGAAAARAPPALVAARAGLEPQDRGAAPRGRRARRGAQGAGLLVVYVDGVQDPGNVGTLVRAAVAFGASALVTSPGSADLFGPKTVRASMGALFAVPVFPELHAGRRGRPAAGGHGVRPRRARRGAARRPPSCGARRCSWSAPSAPASRAPCSAHVDRLVTIPLAPSAAGAVESLNAGVAGAIALYEFSRRAGRRLRRPVTPLPAAQEG